MLSDNHQVAISVCVFVCVCVCVCVYAGRCSKLCVQVSASGHHLLTCVCGAGHDEDPAKAAMGTPLERMMQMGAAMLEAVRAFKPPSPDGKKFEIRLGDCIHPPLHPLLHTQAPALTLSTLQVNSSTIHLSCLHAAYWAV